jgi:hypothetical protein
MADVTRDTFLESKNYGELLWQKGMPVVDADLNEGAKISRIRSQRLVQEMLGLGDKRFYTQKGFRPKFAGVGSETNDFLIRKGYMWRNGVRYYKDADQLYSNQVDEDGTSVADRDKTEINGNQSMVAPTSNTRIDLVFLDCYEAEIDEVQDPDIVNSSINLDTALRTKHMALTRVRLGTESSSPVAPTVPTPPSGHIYYPLAIIYREVVAQEEIDEDWIVQRPIEIWVTSTGDDDNDGTRQATAVRTLQEAVNRVPNFMFEDYRIMISGSGNINTPDFQELVVVSNKMGTEREPSKNLYAKITTSNRWQWDGRPADTYELLIQKAIFDSNHTSWVAIEGSINVYNCSGVFLAGLWVNSSPNIGFDIYGSENVSHAYCIVTNSHIDGIRYTRSSGKAYNCGVGLPVYGGNGSAGISATGGSYLEILGGFQATSNTVGIGSAFGSEVRMGNDIWELSYGSTPSTGRRLLDNIVGIRVQDGASFAKPANQAGSDFDALGRLWIHGGGWGVDVTEAGYAELGIIGFGQYGAETDLPPTKMMFKVTKAGRVKAYDINADGTHPGVNGSAQPDFAHCHQNSFLFVDSVDLDNVYGRAFDVRDNSVVEVETSQPGEDHLQSFFHCRGTGRADCAVIAHNSLIKFGGGYGNNIYSHFDGNTDRTYGFAIINSELFVESTARLVVDGCTQSGGELIANLFAGAKVVGNSYIRYDSHIGTVPDRVGANANYYVDGAVRQAPWEFGTPTDVSASFTIIANDENGGDTYHATT